MNCDVGPISCQLQRIADALVAGPDLWLTIVSGIVVPILLGLATLLVAVASIRTARDATKLNRDMHDERLNMERREKRLKVASQVADWLGTALFTPANPSFPSKADAARAAIDTSPEPSARPLMGWLMHLVHDLDPNNIGTDAAAEPYKMARKVIEEWAESPETLSAVLEVEARLKALSQAAASESARR